MRISGFSAEKVAPAPPATMSADSNARSILRLLLRIATSAAIPRIPDAITEPCGADSAVSSVAGVICDRTQKARVPPTPEVQSALANQSDACLQDQRDCADQRRAGEANLQERSEPGPHFSVLTVVL